MGSYADSLLTEGETVIRRERQHWLSLFLESRLSVLLWGIALVLIIVILGRGRNDDISSGLSLGALAVIILGAIFFAWRWWHWQTDEYVITSRRLLKVEGIVNKRSGDSNLEKINDAILEQNLLGRILDYGDLEILTAAEVVGRPVPDAQSRQVVQEADDDREARARGRSFVRGRRRRRPCVRPHRRRPRDRWTHRDRARRLGRGDRPVADPAGDPA